MSAAARVRDPFLLSDRPPHPKLAEVVGSAARLWDTAWPAPAVRYLLALESRLHPARNAREG
ncbi:hypothetical protein [Streptomyces sp. NPDC001502]|uniref:hypothetical protein n=1 Tax=Streptomyces sp. NPDC001502 TaxID=3364578 RepID=UPI00368B5D53